MASQSLGAATSLTLRWRGTYRVAPVSHHFAMQQQSGPFVHSVRHSPPIIAIATIALFLNAMRAAPLPSRSRSRSVPPARRSLSWLHYSILPACPSARRPPACAGLHAKQLFLSRFRCFANRHCLPPSLPHPRPSTPPSIAVAVVVARIKKSSASVGEGEEEEKKRKRRAKQS